MQNLQIIFGSTVPTRAVVLRGPLLGPPFPPMRNICNSKGHLRAPRFSTRARVDTLRFCSQVGIGSVLLLCSHFLESVGVIPCPNSPRGCLWTESVDLGFLWALGPLHPATHL